MGSDLTAKIGTDFSQWDAGFAHARKTASSFASGLGSLLNPATAALGAAIGGALAGGAAVSGYKESLAAQQKLSAVLEATGGAAGLSTDQISDFASEMQSLTNFEGDATVAAASMLAAFTNIRGQTFTDTIESAMDLSTVMGGDLESNVKLLGKALNDPAEGLAKLAKAGVDFTDAEQKQIKAMQEAGNMAGAQEAILQGLQDRFGGAAEKVRDPWVVLTNTLGDIGENIGATLLPSLNVVTEWATSFLGPVAEMGDSFAEFGAMAAAVLSTTGGMIQRAGNMVYEFFAPAINFSIDTLGELFGFVSGGGSTFLEMFAEAAATFENLGGIIDLAGQQIALFFVTAAADASYFFTDVIPGYLNWFADNWQEIAITAGSNALTVFENYASNVRAVWAAVLDFFKTGTFQVNWTPLTQGFVNTVEKLPNIAPRVATDLEKNLKAGIDSSTEALGNSLEESRKKYASEMGDTFTDIKKKYSPKSPTGPIGGNGNDEGDKSKQGKEAKDNQAAFIGSQEAAKIMTRGLGMPQVPEFSGPKLPEFVGPQLPSGPINQEGAKPSGTGNPSDSAMASVDSTLKTKSMNETRTWNEMLTVLKEIRDNGMAGGYDPFANRIVVSDIG